MDQDMFAAAIEYEQLTRSIYQALLRQQGSEATVLHNQDVVGRSGVAHQIDVLWEFAQAGKRRRMLIECKNYSTTITLEKVRNFFAVMHDIGDCDGLMVTRVGYQSGVEQFARYYGIGLKLIRKPTTADWHGRLKEIAVDMRVRSVVSTPGKPIQLQAKLQPIDDVQEVRLKQLKAVGRLSVRSGPAMVFFNSAGQQATDELRWWISRELKTDGLADGGPHHQRIELADRYVMVNPGEADQEFVQVLWLDVDFHVEEVDRRSIVIDGEQLVEAILKDNSSGEWEYTKLMA